jgi:FkbM family methyltransferase
MPSPVATFKRLLRPARRRVNQLLGRDLNVRVQQRHDVLRLGSEYGGWVVRPELIRPDSIIYCFGVGEDISFDLAVIQRFDVTVHAFDPTPKSMRWIQSQELPKQFVFHNVGLAEYDGAARFVLPRADYASYHISGKNERGADVAECPVQRLSTIMRELGHDRIDLLKMDIEGAEYAAIDDILASKALIAQWLIEFHHVVGDRPSLAKTRRAIEILNKAGYQIFSRSATGMEFSFFRQP